MRTLLASNYITSLITPTHYFEFKIRNEADLENMKYPNFNLLVIQILLTNKKHHRIHKTNFRWLDEKTSPFLTHLAYIVRA